MHNSSRRDKGQPKAKKLKTVFIQHTVNKITLSFHFISVALAEKGGNALTERATAGLVKSNCSIPPGS